MRLNILDGNIRAVRASDGRDYICVRDVCAALGFSGEHISYQITKIRKNPDLVVCYETFPVMTAGGLQQVGFLRADMMAAWLDGLMAKHDVIQSRIATCRDVISCAGLQIQELVLDGAAEKPVCVYIDNSEGLIARFAIEIIPLCAWDYLPFLFLYDLCKGWLRRENAFTRMPSRSAVTDIISEMTETDLRSWRVVTRGVRPMGFMDKKEPLLETYNVVGWDEPYGRPCTSGLVRTELSGW